MRIPRLRYSMLGLMGLVALSAVGLVGWRVWDFRYDRGAPYHAEAAQMARFARIDRKLASESRDCPRLHSPWKTRFQCPGCIPCPMTYRLDNHGKPLDHVPQFTTDSQPGRELRKRFLEAHEAVAREFEAEAQAAENLSRKYLRAAWESPEAELPITSAERDLRSGNTLSNGKYRYDWY